MPLFHLSSEDIEPIPVQSFGPLGVSERNHLQRVLRSRIEVTAPDCMVLAEEFCEWDESWRRIDLLALDRRARLVVIELKRTNDAGHAELQALRYAAMVSTMTFEQAVAAHGRFLKQIGEEDDPRERILSFLGWQEPEEEDFAPAVRIVLVSADFSKELTTSVLWLRNYKIDIECVRIVPHLMDGKVLLNVERVIPLAETAEYQIRVQQREEIRREAAASPDRYQKYDIIDGDTVETQLYKRHALHRMVKALAKRGVTPEQMSAAVPSYGNYLFVSVNGELDSDAFIDAARLKCAETKRAFDPSRFAKQDDELIHSNGRTYAVTNQVGKGIETVLTQLSTAFPFDDVRWERSSEG